MIRYVTPWDWPLTPWPWTFTALRVSCVSTLYKIWAKSNNPRLSYWLFNTFFHHAILGGRALLPNSSRGCVLRGPNFTIIGEDTGISSLRCMFVSEFIYLAAFSNASCSKLSNVENDAKFRTFDPCDQLMKLYLRPNLRNIFDGCPLRGCWATCTDKKKEKYSSIY